MNVLLPFFIAVAFFIIGYKFYGDKIARLWEMDEKNPTPALTKGDAVDYVPAKHWTILFGHHFASIAGAGPIIGPVIAVAFWGWAPVFCWIILGSILLGAVHDFSSLMISLRNKGHSIAKVTEDIISHRAKITFTLFLWFTLILVIAVFAAVGAKTLVDMPQIVIPTFGLIVVAFLIGKLIYELKFNQLSATLMGVGLLFLLIIIGKYYPVIIPEIIHFAGLKFTNHTFWTFALLIYAFLASVMPVNLLLQPRDYLATFVLYFGLFFGYLGILITRPSFNVPAFIKFKGSEGGALWPMLFVVVACGAISGFHSLVSGGTTSKQIANEKDAKKIAFGAMIIEGALALLALFSVSAGLYWYGGEEGLVYPELIRDGNWIVTFGKGFGELVKPIFGVSLGALLAVTMLKTFIMTTLDSATRITRYITEELFFHGFKFKWAKNKYLISFIIVLFSGWLSLGRWKIIWPIFGAANQLVAALTLLVLTAYLLSKGKPVKVVLWPAVFMLVTTLGALLILLKEFFTAGKWFLLSIDCFLLILSLSILQESVVYFKKWRLRKCLS
ncbi:MAG: carbon starvation protein A [Candidatus Omnitrophota bacterium]